jgi:transcriptional regulator
MRAYVDQVAFGALFVATPEGPRVVHLPVTWSGEDALAFHLARANDVTPHLAGATALFVAQGPDAYVSPGWYGQGPQEVPTWNYVAVELEGTVQPIDRALLRAQIETLGERHEGRFHPEAPWTLDKVEPEAAEKMLDAIQGFTLTIHAWRGTAKLGQNKPAHARLAAADALERTGNGAIAQLMRSAS